MNPPDDLQTVFSAHRRALWSLGYRMLGTATDAEDAVQDTFVRALERPPTDVSLPWKPWLVRVLVNGCRDRLRRRRRRPYPGPWLPSPVPTELPEELALDGLFADAGPAPDARVELLESVSIAFLCALEVLTPMQRAVLVLRDVCDCSGAEAAAVLGTTEGNVKVSLHRARRALAAADPARQAPTVTLQAAALDVLGRFAAALQSGDVAALRAVVADDVRLLSDGGGVVFAANKPVLGGDAVAAVYHGLAAATRDLAPSWRLGMFNGLPAVVTSLPDPPRRWSPHSVITLVPGADGRVARIYSVLAPAKLEGVKLDGSGVA